MLPSIAVPNLTLGHVSHLKEKSLAAWSRGKPDSLRGPVTLSRKAGRDTKVVERKRRCLGWDGVPSRIRNTLTLD